MSAAPEGLRERVNACLKPMVGLVASHPWMGAAYDACWELIAAELDLGVRRAVGPDAARARALAPKLYWLCDPTSDGFAPITEPYQAVVCEAAALLRQIGGGK